MGSLRFRLVSLVSHETVCERRFRSGNWPLSKLVVYYYAWIRCRQPTFLIVCLRNHLSLSLSLSKRLSEEAFMACFSARTKFKFLQRCANRRAKYCWERNQCDGLLRGKVSWYVTNNSKAKRKRRKRQRTMTRSQHGLSKFNWNKIQEIPSQQPTAAVMRNRW